MKHFRLMLLLILVGCGVPGPIGPQGPSGTDGTQGAKGDTGTKGDTGAQGAQGTAAATPVSLEGYYLLPNGGYADIYQDASGTYTIRSLRLVLPNADTSGALVPVASSGLIYPVNNALYYSLNVAYVAGNNVKQDGNSVVMVGTQLTELIFTKTGTVLTVRAIVNGLSSALFDHSVSSL